MTDVTIPDIVLRTTSDGGGYVHGLAIGTGANLDQAVRALMTEAERQATEVTRAAADSREPVYEEGPVTIVDGQAVRPKLSTTKPPPPLPVRYYEVADVRLTHVPGGGDETWVAYGTLRSSIRPQSDSFWDDGRT